MYNWLLDLKYVGIFILMRIFPSESIMPLSGHLAAAGQASLPGVIAVGTAGSVAGSTLIYILSWALGPQIYEYINRHGKWVGVTPRSVGRASQWFDAHAKATVFFGRFVPGVRTAVSVPAGVVGMPPLTFVMCTLFGSGIWITFLAAVGYLARVEYAQIQSYASYAATGIEVALVLFIVALVARYRHK
jgi:membrane protein DedA with SNARE-associated domain